MGLRRILRRARNLLNKRVVQLQNEFLRNQRVLGQPFQLTLEPGNVCNLRCPLCPTPTRETRLPKGLLKLDDARRILAQFPYTVQLVLSNWGEPFLNKEIFAIIALAKERDIHVHVESNLTLFDEGKARALVASGLDVLVVALDGASQETYERYRVGGRFADVLANVRTLRRVQDELDDHRTELRWKFVVNKHNEHELESARQLARELGLTFQAVTIWTPPDRRDEWLPSAALHTDGRNVRGGPPRCHHLWQAVAVNFNGDVFPCCSEFSPQDKLVNVLEQPFAPVWNSPTLRARRALNKGPVDCSRCHLDRDTNWYRTWIGAAEPRDEFTEPRHGL
jgi:radical SAM protein with 4Fe4S-binding SPASM domain